MESFELFWMLKFDIKFGKSSDWKNQANVWPWLDLDGSGPTQRRRRLRFIPSLGNHLEAATNISTLISAKAVNTIVSRESSPSCLKVKRPRLRSMWIMNLGSRIYVLLHSTFLWMRYVDLGFSWCNIYQVSLPSMNSRQALVYLYQFYPCMAAIAVEDYSIDPKHLMLEPPKIFPHLQFSPTNPL